MSGRAHRLAPAPSARPWGGGRFGSLDGVPVGELWVSGDAATLPDGRTLAEAGWATRVPLVKLLDVAGLLSVQVHPDDAQARALAGPGAVGKHEAWVVLEAAADAFVLLGLEPGASVEALFSGVPERVRAALSVAPVRPGDVIDVPPGTVHAPSAGLVLYEIQQRSDLTYRIWDWGRPRPLHLAEARDCLRPEASPAVARLPTGPGRARLDDPGAPFRLEQLRIAGGEAALELREPIVLSVVEGGLDLGADGIEAPASSHWLIEPGELVVRGTGSALLASW